MCLYIFVSFWISFVQARNLFTKITIACNVHGIKVTLRQNYINIRSLSVYTAIITIVVYTSACTDPTHDNKMRQAAGSSLAVPTGPGIRIQLAEIALAYGPADQARIVSQLASQLLFREVASA